MGLRPRSGMMIVSKAMVLMCFRTRLMFMNPTDFCNRSQFLDMVAGRDAFAVSMGRIVGGRRDGNVSGGIVGTSDRAMESSSTASCIFSSVISGMDSSGVGMMSSSMARDDGLYSVVGVMSDSDDWAW